MLLVQCSPNAHQSPDSSRLTDVTDAHIHIYIYERKVSHFWFSPDDKLKK